jgi:uncharacterized membrane protein YccC
MRRLAAVIGLGVFIAVIGAMALVLDAFGWKFALGAIAGFGLAQIGFRLQYGFWHQGY